MDKGRKAKPSKPANKKESHNHNSQASEEEESNFKENLPKSIEEFMKCHGVDNLDDLHYRLMDLVRANDLKRIFLMDRKLSAQGTKDVIYKIFHLFDSYSKNLKENQDHFSPFNKCFRVVYSVAEGLLVDLFKENVSDDRYKQKEKEKQDLGIKRDTNLNYEFLVFEHPSSDKQSEFPFSSYEDKGNFFIFRGLAGREEVCVCDKKFKCINMYSRVFSIAGGEVLVGEKNKPHESTEQFLISSQTGKKIKIPKDKDSYQKIYIFGTWIVGETNEKIIIKHTYDGIYGDEKEKVIKPKVKQIMELKDYSNY
jgi:hypothetical protein